MLKQRRTRLLAYATGALLVALCASAYAYDSSRNDRVTEGVSVAGVDVGGQSRSQAKQRLRDLLAPALHRRVLVRVAGRRFRLSADRASLVVDVDGMAETAIDRGRSGGLPVRVWRSITGGRVDKEVPASVSYSSSAVRRFVRRIVKAVNRPARDASVRFLTASLPAVPSRTGLRVRRAALASAVQSALAQTGSGRDVRGQVRVTRPKVTTAELAKKYPVVVNVDRPGFSLRLFKRLRLQKTYKIAVGQAGLETPAGLYHVESKAVNPSWHVPNSAWAGDLAGRVIPPGPDNPIKARWLGIFAGAGIHGTSDIGSLGTAASHGCIRMAIPDVEVLYDQVPLHAPVFIQ